MYAFPDRKSAPQASTLDLLALARATAEVSIRDPQFQGKARRRRGWWPAWPVCSRRSR